MFSNKKIELVRKRQKGGIVATVKGELAKHINSTGADSTGLGR